MRTGARRLSRSPHPAVAVCSAAPFLGAGEPNPSPDDAAVVGTVTEAHTELFAGAWWDAGAQEYVSTAIDATRAGSVLSVELPATLRRRVETVPRSDAQLAALQARVTELAAGGVLAGVAVPRNRLPAAPFTVTTERYCGVCEDAVVSTLGG